MAEGDEVPASVEVAGPVFAAAVVCYQGAVDFWVFGACFDVGA